MKAERVEAGPAGEQAPAGLLELLAVVGRVQPGWLPPAMLQPALPPGVAWQGEWLSLDPAAGRELLDSLEENDLPRFCLVHQQAIQLTAGLLRAGGAGAAGASPAVEQAFLAAFERLANRLLLDDPQGFVALVQAAADLPLASLAGQQKMTYFQALALVKSDRYAEAIPIFDRLLAGPGLLPETRGRALNSRANCYYLTGRFEQALQDYQASLELWRAAGNPLRQGIALLNLGVIAYELQEYPRAEASLSEAARQFEAAGSVQWLASARNELGLVQRDLGHWEQALACFEAAAEQRRRDGALDSLGAALNNQGEVLLLQGRLDEAAGRLEAALQAMSTRVWAVDAHLNLGLIRQVGGDLDSARAEYEQALQICEATGRRDILSQVHYRLGETLRRQGENVLALEHLRLGAQAVEAVRQPLQDEGLKISLLGRWQQVYEALVLHCVDLGLVEEAFLWAERSRARAFAESLARGRQPAGEQGEPHLPPADAASAAELQAGLAPGTLLLYYFTTGVLERDIPMLRALPPGALRQHLLPAASTLLFIITRRRLEARLCPLDPNLLGSVSPRGEADRSRFLSPVVLERLQQALLVEAGLAQGAEPPAGCARLVVVPHGPLHWLPFCAFPLLAGGPPLSYAPSATLLARPAPPAPGPGAFRLPCLAVGYDGSPAPGIQDLLPGRPGSMPGMLSHPESEALFIASLGGGEAWTGPRPKRDALRRLAPGCRRLHFSCHAWFNHEAPMESYLETGLDERLSARQVLENWKLQAELVTLSACQTGVSRILRSDEPLGLVRAFLSAGARAVLASQWPVEDLPTLLLMQRFYAELERLGDAAAALRAAQGWLRCLTAGEAAARWQDSLAPALPGTANPFLSLPAGERLYERPACWAGFILVEG